VHEVEYNECVERLEQILTSVDLFQIYRNFSKIFPGVCERIQPGFAGFW
jgi:predicted CoA-binding protein